MLVTFFIILSCSSTPAPSWQANAHIQMENYIETFMSGKENFAETHYERFYENLLLTADPDIIIKAPLTKCAIEFSIFIESNCESAAELIPMTKDDENRNYFRFITSSRKLDTMTGKYRRVVESVSKCDVERTNRAISRVEEGVSTLIAASYAVRHNCYNEDTLLKALSVASENGWIKASGAYLEKLESYYVSSGQSSKADEVRKRIELISK